MMTILYTVGDGLYVNLTNRCPCNCTFCIRHNGDGAYGSDSLWLDREPEVDEVIAELEKYGDLSQFKEVVFCGYGEPMERAGDVAFLGHYIRDNYGIPVRVNTNGLSDRINGRPTAQLLDGAADVVSVSLNQCCAEKYNEVTRSKWDNAFESVIAFATDCKKYVPKVIFTVVDVIPPEDISRCKAVAMSLGIELRVRTYDS